MSNQLKGISFREVLIDDAELILKWRTKQRITKYMNTDISNDFNAQIKWLLLSKEKYDYYHWIIQIGNSPIGFINLAGYSRENKSTSWGFYIGEDNFLGFGGFIFPCFYNWAFNVLKVEKITAEIFFDNVNVIRLHQLYGNKFVPHADRVITKNGKDILIVAMELTKDLWEAKRCKNFTTSFPIKNWKKRPI